MLRDEPLRDELFLRELLVLRELLAREPFEELRDDVLRRLDERRRELEPEERSEAGISSCATALVSTGI